MRDADFPMRSWGLSEPGELDRVVIVSPHLDDAVLGCGRFMAVQQAVGIPKGHDAGLAYLRVYVEEAKASGLVARSIEKTGFRGVAVAPRSQ
jgi:hypothetical protein